MERGDDKMHFTRGSEGIDFESEEVQGLIIFAVGSMIVSAVVLSVCCFFCCCACVVGSFYKMHTSIKDLDHAC